MCTQANQAWLSDAIWTTITRDPLSRAVTTSKTRRDPPNHSFRAQAERCTHADFLMLPEGVNSADGLNEPCEKQYPLSTVGLLRPGPRAPVFCLFHIVAPPFFPVKKLQDTTELFL